MSESITQIKKRRGKKSNPEGMFFKAAKKIMTEKKPRKRNPSKKKLPVVPEVPEAPKYDKNFWITDAPTNEVRVKREVLDDDYDKDTTYIFANKDFGDIIHVPNPKEHVTEPDQMVMPVKETKKSKDDGEVFFVSRFRPGVKKLTGKLLETVKAHFKDL
jgi:hypothetical protein